MSLATTVQPESFLARFGLRQFRPGQREAIEAVMTGEDCLCVMPTGGGKSLCYQLPAIASSGVTLVVSPLIALMKDQVDALTDLGISAALINSTLTLHEQNERLNALAAGKYRIVYVVPERFRSPRFVEAARAARVKLLAVDEAHCISQWGHDFRPDYAKLGRFRATLGDPPTIALTATATEAVRSDIINQLRLSSPRIVVTGFARPNLRYAVVRPASSRRKDAALVEFLNRTPGSGIVYVSSRKRSEEVAATIQAETGRKTGVYHAGMMGDERKAAQDRFMGGKDEIVVATTAFGMGIDKADVRFVVHYNLPGTIEGYYQEAGRAGRDGKPSECLLIYHPTDCKVQEFFIESAYPSPDIVERVYDYLRSQDADPIELTQQELKEKLSLQIGAEGVGACEQLLERAGVLERLEPFQNMAIVRIDTDSPNIADLVSKQSKTQRKVLSALERVVGSRRFENVYFRPTDLASATELDAASLRRTLRELGEMKFFSYVPPFRGRAVHMLEQDKPFSELAIDFESLEKRRRDAYDKLARVVQFANLTTCREIDILEYFGQTDSAECTRCDNCRSFVTTGECPKTALSHELPDDALQLVRKALSGVARTKARFGKTIIAQMLRGSSSAKITRNGLQKLSTFGLFKDHRQDDIVALLDSLIEAKCLVQAGDDPMRPLLTLTPFGSEVMWGKAAPKRLAIPRAFNVSPSRSASAHLMSPSVPAESSEETTHTSMNGCVPVSPCSNGEDLPLNSSKEAKTNGEEKAKPPYYWTWRMLTAGFTVDECMAALELDRSAVLDHALRAQKNGLRVTPEWFIPALEMRRLDSRLGDCRSSQIRPLLKDFPTLSYEEIQLYANCRDVNSSVDHAR